MHPWDMHVWIFVWACTSLGRNSFLWYPVRCLAVWVSGLRLAISPHSDQEDVWQDMYRLQPFFGASGSSAGAQRRTINKNCPRRARWALPSCDHMNQRKPEIQQLWIHEFQHYAYEQSASETLLVPGINIQERKKKRPSNINTWEWS